MIADRDLARPLLCLQGTGGWLRRSWRTGAPQRVFDNHSLTSREDLVSENLRQSYTCSETSPRSCRASCDTEFRGDITMRAHGQTTIWDVRLGIRAPAGSSDWLRRLRSWVKPPKRHCRATVPSVGYAHWDNQRERLQPPITEAALDRAAAQLGPSWAILLYSSLE
jgi:hypothetical protein